MAWLPEAQAYTYGKRNATIRGFLRRLLRLMNTLTYLLTYLATYLLMSFLLINIYGSFVETFELFIVQWWNHWGCCGNTCKPRIVKQKFIRRPRMLYTCVKLTTLQNQALNYKATTYSTEIGLKYYFVGCSDQRDGWMFWCRWASPPETLPYRPTYTGKLIYRARIARRWKVTMN